MIRGIGRLARSLVPFPRDLSLAWKTIKGQRGGFVGSFVAIAVGSAVITACGILLMSGLRTGVAPERYAGADVVLSAGQSFALDESSSVRYSERVTLPAGTAAAVAAVPGVRAAADDDDVRLSVLGSGGVVGGPDGHPVYGHGWTTAEFGPFSIRKGHAPTASDEVVLDSGLASRAHLSPGSTVRLVVGSIPSSYRVVGIADPPPGGLARQSAVFLTDAQAIKLSGRPDRVDAVGVLAAPGITPDRLAKAISAAVPGVETHTGTGRGDAEFLDVGDARSLVVDASSSFGGTMVLIVVFVVASTLTLSVQQRRRELALMRAIGATPRQIHWAIGAEMTLVSFSGALVGAIPGIALAFVMRWVFILAGAMPADYRMDVGVLPILASLVLCMFSARISGWLVARRVAGTSPVEALGEAAVEPKRLSKVRLIIGVLLIPLGLFLTLGNVADQGDSVADVAGSAVLVFVVALGCLGPVLLRGAVALFGPLLNNQTRAQGFLAQSNSRANVRRLSAAATPLAIGVTLAAVQIFGASTTIAASQHQLDDGLRARHVLTASSGAGVSPQVAEAVSKVPGVLTVTPVARMQTLLSFGNQTKVFAAEGVAPEGLFDTMDLHVLHGRITDLKDGTVALSQVAAREVGAKLGGTILLRLGDSTKLKPRVVAIYERGLGFGDVTLSNSLVVAHTTSQVDSAVMVAARAGTDQEKLTTALRKAVAPYPTVKVGGSGEFGTAPDSDGSGGWALNLLFQALLLGYIAIAVVNSLVMATAARVREFAMLRLIGAHRDQVRAMMNGESRIVIFSALLFGLLSGIPSLVGMSLGLSKSPVPSISWLGLVAIVAITVAFAWGSIAAATRFALRPAPVDAIGGRE